MRLDARARLVAAASMLRAGVDRARLVAENPEADPKVRRELLRLLERHADQIPVRLERRTFRSRP